MYTDYISLAGVRLRRGPGLLGGDLEFLARASCNFRMAYLEVHGVPFKGYFEGSIRAPLKGFRGRVQGLGYTWRFMGSYMWVISPLIWVITHLQLPMNLEVVDSSPLE